MLDLVNSIKNRSNKILKIVTGVIYIVAIMIYEFLFCNSAFVKGCIDGNISNYNFSLARVVLYILFAFFYVKYIDNFSQKALENLKSKYKIFALILINLIFACSMLYAIKTNIIYYKKILIILAWLMSIVLTIYVTRDLEKNMIIFCMTLGILFCCTTQLNGSLDEKRHFLSAYNISIGNLDYRNHTKTEVSLERIQRVCPLSESMQFFGQYYENAVYENKDAPTDHKATNYNFLLYVPSAIGIKFATALHGSVADIYIIGRIFNLLAYTALTILIFKILPFKKNVFYVIYLLPMLVLLAGSYSVDGMCVCFVGLFIAYCLKLYKDEKEVKTKQIIILAALFVLSLLAKEMSYIFISVLLLLLPISKIVKQNKKTMIGTIIVVIMVIFGFAASILLNPGSESLSDTRNLDTSVEGQIKFILKNPMSDVMLIMNHIKGTLLDFNWWRYLSPVEFVGKASSLLVLQIVFILYVAISDNSAKFNNKEKIIISIAFFASYFAGSILLYLSFTSVGKLYIEGYQTRYLFPVLPLLLMIMNNNNKENDENYREKISIVLAIFMAIEIIGLISRV